MNPFAAMKWAAIAAVVLALLTGVTYSIHTYNAMVRAEGEVSAQKATMEQMQADHNAVVHGLEKASALSDTRTRFFNTIRSAINAAQTSKACAGSAPVRALFDGLRAADTDQAGASSSSAGKPTTGGP